MTKTASGTYRQGMSSGATSVRHVDDAGGFQENYEALANAIVIQAVKDYKEHLRTLLRHPHSREASGKAQSIEHFFHSSWYEMLTDLDPDMLISGVQEMVKNEEEERRKKKLEKLKKEAALYRREVMNLLLFLDGGTLIPEPGMVMLRAMDCRTEVQKAEDVRIVAQENEQKAVRTQSAECSQEVTAID